MDGEASSHLKLRMETNNMSFLPLTEIKCEILIPRLPLHFRPDRVKIFLQLPSLTISTNENIQRKLDISPILLIDSSCV